MNDEATGRALIACLNAIMADFGVTDLPALQRYESAAAGVYIHFQLHDGTYVHPGDRCISDPDFINWVRKVGIGAAILGNDEVDIAPQWIDLLEFAVQPDKYTNFDRDAAERVRALMGEVEEAATALWNDGYEGESE